MSRILSGPLFWVVLVALLSACWLAYSWGTADHGKSSSESLTNSSLTITLASKRLLPACETSTPPWSSLRNSKEPPNPAKMTSERIGTPIGPQTQPLKRPADEPVSDPESFERSLRLPSPVVIRQSEREERQAELAATPERDRSQPYVISHEEFFEEQLAYSKLSITYYVADETLADDKDGVIPNTHATVGPGFTTKFGQLSGDPNVLFVRNERIEVDFEITKDQRSYTEVVLGYGNPSNIKKTIRKPRNE
jgi:hypothetical protein